MEIKHHVSKFFNNFEENIWILLFNILAISCFIYAFYMLFEHIYHWLKFGSWDQVCFGCKIKYFIPDFNPYTTWIGLNVLISSYMEMSDFGGFFLLGGFLEQFQN